MIEGFDPAAAVPKIVLPLTDKLSVTVKSLGIVTSSVSPIVIVFVLNTDVISFAVPIIFKSEINLFYSLYDLIAA